MAYFATKHKAALPSGKTTTVEQVVVAESFINAALIISQDVDEHEDNGVVNKVEERFWADVIQDEEDSSENPFWEVKVEVESVTDKDYTDLFLIQGEKSDIVSNIALSKVDGAGRIVSCKETKIKAIIHEQRD